jgi:GTP cyclohydrolase III
VLADLLISFLIINGRFELFTIIWIITHLQTDLFAYLRTFSDYNTITFFYKFDFEIWILNVFYNTWINSIL